MVILLFRNKAVIGEDSILLQVRDDNDAIRSALELSDETIQLRADKLFIGKTGDSQATIFMSGGAPNYGTYTHSVIETRQFGTVDNSTVNQNSAGTRYQNKNVRSGNRSNQNANCIKKNIKMMIKKK
mgnify:FL=1